MSISWHTKDNGYERPLGASEFAFVPASVNGLGDMFLHLSFRAPHSKLSQRRIGIAWAIIRARHPLLMSRVLRDGFKFRLDIPKTREEAIQSAEDALDFQTGREADSREEIIYKFMNGPRILSHDRLSFLKISTRSILDSDRDYDLLMCAPHFTGDGTSLHQSTHEILTLLAGEKSDDELLNELPLDSVAERLPQAFETCVVDQHSRFKKAVLAVNHLQVLSREIGGHTLPRRQRGPQRTIFVETSFTEEQTRGILARCKEKGVTVNHAVFVLCNVAWARTQQGDKTLPMMMYSAANLRPLLPPAPEGMTTYWFLALTYFNVVLPAFLPSSVEAFWNRARQVKAQVKRIVGSKFMLDRALEGANDRAARTRGEAASIPQRRLPSLSESPPPPPPSKALLGLSLIGNLDTTYVRSAYPSFTLHSVITASRQKPGGILLLEHTFAGKLWLQMFYDANGFVDDLMDVFWDQLGRAVEEFLM